MHNEASGWVEWTKAWGPIIVGMLAAIVALYTARQNRKADMEADRQERRAAAEENDRRRVHEQRIKVVGDVSKAMFMAVRSIRGLTVARPEDMNIDADEVRTATEYLLQLHDTFGSVSIWFSKETQHKFWLLYTVLGAVVSAHRGLPAVVLDDVPSDGMIVAAVDAFEESLRSDLEVTLPALKDWLRR